MLFCSMDEILITKQNILSCAIGSNKNNKTLDLGFVNVTQIFQFLGPEIRYFRLNTKQLPHHLSLHSIFKILHVKFLEVKSLHIGLMY